VAVERGGGSLGIFAFLRCNRVRIEILEGRIKDGTKGSERGLIFAIADLGKSCLPKPPTSPKRTEHQIAGKRDLAIEKPWDARASVRRFCVELESMDSVHLSRYGGVSLILRHSAEPVIDDFESAISAPFENPLQVPIAAVSPVNA